MWSYAHTHTHVYIHIHTQHIGVRQRHNKILQNVTGSQIKPVRTFLPPYPITYPPTWRNALKTA